MPLKETGVKVSSPNLNKPGGLVDPGAPGTTDDEMVEKEKGWFD